jgi:general secretion pathway protein A
VGPYLEHRVAAAGGAFAHIFAAGVESAFFEFSRGCPRLVNLLGDRVLLAAFAQQLRPITKELVEQKAKEMAAARSPRPAAPEE